MRLAIGALLAACGTLAACAPQASTQAANAAALSALAMPADPTLPRLQSRTYPGASPTQLTQAATGALQDLGFTINETGQDGIITASKTRSAVEAGQVAGEILKQLPAAILFGPGGAQPTFDKSQEIHVTILVSPGGPGDNSLHLYVDRAITDNHGTLSRTEQVNDARVYTEFFTDVDGALQGRRTG